MEKLKFGDVVRIKVDRSIFGGYAEGTLAMVEYVKDMNVKCYYYVTDFTNKFVIEENHWYSIEDLEFTGRNLLHEPYNNSTL